VTEMCFINKLCIVLPYFALLKNAVKVIVSLLIVTPQAKILN